MNVYGYEVHDFWYRVRDKLNKNREYDERIMNAAQELIPQKMWQVFLVVRKRAKSS